MMTLTGYLTVIATGLSSFSAVSAQVTFVNQATAAGVLNPSFGRGAAMVDLDGDGRLDLVEANAGMDNAIFRQLADHTFVNVTAAWGLAPDNRQSWGVAVADFDNDGDPDIYFVNGGFTAWEANQLLRNDLKTLGVLTDVSSSAGAAGSVVKMSDGVTTLDYDRDGWLDIFVSNTDGQKATLLHNEGGLFFTDSSSAAGVDKVGGYGMHCSSGDFNNDGFDDIGVGQYLGNPNNLFRNNGNGTFTDIAASAGVASPYANFGMVFADFNNDGWEDIYIPKYQSISSSPPSPVLLNNGNETFTNVSPGLGLQAHLDMGHNVADVDADGFPDIFIGTGGPASKAPDVLFLVRPGVSGGLVVTDVSQSSGILASGPTRCHGIAFGDYDEDGDIDIFLNNGGITADPTTLEPDFLWQSQGNDNAWLEVELEGVLSNRSAVGARAVCTTSDGRKVHLHVTAGQGFGNTDSYWQHFGLGVASGVERVDVHWPSGIEQILLGPELSSRTHLVETGTLLAGTPSPGASIDLRFAGSPADQVLLLLSFGTADNVLPGHGGILHLDLASLVILGVLTLDGSGKLTLPALIPNKPALSGLEVYLQGWFHLPSAAGAGTLGNLVTISIV